MTTGLPWVGGKSRQGTFLASLMPTDMKVYVEPFCGGCNVLYAKPKTRVEIVNDAYGDLINFWRVCRDHHQELIDSFKFVPHARDVYYEYAREQKESNLEEDPIKRAHRFLYLLCYGFGADMDGTYSFGTRRCVRHGPSPVERIEKLWERLQGVVIENLDYARMWDLYDSEVAFFFVDPPYHISKNRYTEKAFAEDDYQKLADLCRNMQGRFLLTLNDDPFIRETFAEFSMQERGIRYSKCRSTEGRRKFPELLISNYDLDDVQGAKQLVLLQKDAATTA